jgi:hypothetical protein
VDGKETFGLWVEPAFLKREFDEQRDIIRIQIDARRAGRPDLIAEEVYGSFAFFWVLIAFNRPKNPIGWPPIGIVIRAPLKEIVLANL